MTARPRSATSSRLSGPQLGRKHGPQLGSAGDARAAALQRKPPDTFARYADNPWFGAGGGPADKSSVSFSSNVSWSRPTIDHSTMNRNTSGVRTFVAVQPGDRVRMRETALQDPNAPSLHAFISGAPSLR